jgi:hypothetical protein
MPAFAASLGVISWSNNPRKLFDNKGLIARLAQQQSTRLYVASIKNLLNGLSSIADLLRTFPRGYANYSSASTYASENVVELQVGNSAKHTLLHGFSGTFLAQ